MDSTAQLSTKNPDKHQITLLRANEVSSLLAISKATLYRWVKDPGRGMPKQISLGPKVSVWRLADIEQFILRQEDKSGAA